MIHTLIAKRFNEDGNLIFMATSHKNIPAIRALTPYYEKGCFYFISNSHSNKIKQLQENPYVALCGSWFNASGKAHHLGSLHQMNSSLKNNILKFCHSWIELGHVDIESDDTIVIQVQLVKGYIVENDKRYEFDYS